MADVFAALPAKSQSLSVTTTSASLTLDASSPQVVIHNDGSATALILFGTGSLTASTSDGGWAVSMPAGGVASWTKGAATTMAAVTASGSTTLRVSQGVGA